MLRQTRSKDMKAIILAAGAGTRLSRDLPKVLVPLRRGETILDYQLERLRGSVAIEEILVVVGYKKEVIVKRYPSLKFVYNDDFARTNTSKSLLKAIDEIGDVNVLWLNGDVVFEEELIRKLINASSEVKKSCLLVDSKRCGEEEIKYRVGNGFIVEISKQVGDPHGEALGINFVTRGDLPLLKKHLARVNDSDYFEKALENMIKEEGTKFLPVATEGLFCHEIDFEEDLVEVQRHLLESERE